MKLLFEQNGGIYRKESYYLIPNLSLPVGERPVGATIFIRVFHNKY